MSAAQQFIEVVFQALGAVFIAVAEAFIGVIFDTIITPLFEALGQG